VNPLVGRESQFPEVDSGALGKKVVVIGGGPAGMTAALTVRKRGAHVALFELSDSLGGQLQVARKLQRKEKIGWLSDYLSEQIRISGVKLHLREKADFRKVSYERPDAVILATGAVPVEPKWPDWQEIQSVDAWSVIAGFVEIKDCTVLVVGGGSLGCECALELVNQNRVVIIAEITEQLAVDMEPINRMDLLFTLEESGIEIRLGTKVEAIGPQGVLIDSAGCESLIKADAVVTAVGVRPRKELIEALLEFEDRLLVIGDCNRPRKIIDAIYEGFSAGLRI